MIQAFAAFKPKGSLKPFVYREPKLGTYDVKIAISHCGLCHSDLHLLDDDWKISHYPFVPGHEIIGTIISKGSGVKGMKIGQRVGIGWQAGACLSCDFCIQGEETFCTQKFRTCVEGHGGFATHIVANSHFAYPIPKKLASEEAAPLLCAGITVYAPFRTHGIQAPMSVAVLGIGGLGHLALQFARAFGCHVTAISSTKKKEAEARQFGAHAFASFKEVKKLSKSFDFILSTVHADLDWSSIIGMLRPKGRICLVGLPQNDLQLPARLLVSGNRSLSGSSTGSRRLMREMLSFAADHNIVPKTELFPIQDVNKAIERLRANKARYRIVLTMK
jgi:uncharacterized zinc-type alcohol dehydrogenase-like protein